MKTQIEATFEDTSLANEARQYLIDNGYKADSITVTSKKHTKPTEPEEKGETGIGEKIGEFFDSIFGSLSSTPPADPIARESVIKVEAESNTQAAKISEILYYYGATDQNGYTKEYCTGQTAYSL
jgi:hypothetical protein